ncbi:MAG: hypothetical protein A2Y38_24640 [Spirochaetes bacterium GWB1_59_5]|nr:MAG: hypothetical protein A2Y38_24640 [Spirochaetes bacterium GWB1_59_5]
MLTENQCTALAWLGQNSHGSFDAWRLAGPHNTDLRQQIFEMLTGRDTPKAKCGVNALKQEFRALVPPSLFEGCGCEAAREAKFKEWAEATMCFIGPVR